MSLLNPLRPFEETGLTRPSSVFEDLFRDLWSPVLASPRAGGLTRFVPRLNVNEKADAYEIECELPGVRPEDVKVTLTGDTLTIQGEKRSDEQRQGDTWHVTECSYGAFQRSLSFPAPIDPDGIDATNENGVLKVRVAKSEESQPRRIEVKSHRKELETSAKEVQVTGGAEEKGSKKKVGKS